MENNYKHMKKLLFLSTALLAAVACFSLAGPARAATPTLSLSTTGSGDNVEIDVVGDHGYNVLMYYQKTDGTSNLIYLGSTNSSGVFSTTISTAAYSISPSALVYVNVNNQQSNSVAWPYNTTTGGAITFSQTGSVLTVGKAIALTVNNAGSNTLYLLNNTNPQVANVSISSGQVNITANTYGQTVVTVCVLGTTTNCASNYVTVQNSGAQVLTFSQSNLTVAYGQSSTVTILNGTTGTSGTGNYTILNNSNPSIIQATISNSTITLTAQGNNGSASLTVCSTDMSSCGIINASAGNTSSSGLIFSQTTPSLLIGQTLNIPMSGGGSTYNVSTNSNTNVVAASITSTNNLTLVGNGVGSAVITVCSSSGNCGSVTATVSYATSGPITLSQNNLWLQVGQAASVAISGGTMPYSLLNTASSSTIVQSSLNTNILTLTGVAAGSSSLSVCSAGGACVQLSILVNGISSSGQLTFSNNNLSLLVGSSATVSLYGNGGYYISNTTNQNVATITLSGSQVSISALTAGSANATLCQTGGQCGVIYVSVTSNTPTATPPAFSPSSPAVSVGQTVNVKVYGGSSSNYYVSSNSNPSIVQATIASANLTLVGELNGSSVVVVCAASNNCNSLPITVSNSVPVTTNPGTGNSSTGSTGATGGNTGNTASDTTLTAITNEAAIISGGSINVIIGNVGAARNTTLEKTYLTQYVKPLTKGLSLTTAAINNLDYFIVYGTPTTKKIGAAERASILSSYLLAYSKLPVTSAQWLDLLRISQGYVPTATSAAAETQAKKEFVKIYKRAAVVTNSSDLSAIKMIAYGVRTVNRNTKSEQAATVKFRSVYGHAPVNVLAWNIVRAIAYSGVSK
jgi:ferredoxin